MGKTQPMYWNGNGKYQALYDKLKGMIPDMGEVPHPKDNKALERLRKAANCYYDLFNNGLDNSASEFRRIFGFGGRWIAKQGFPYYDPLEKKLDEFILAAAREQGIRTLFDILKEEWTAGDHGEIMAGNEQIASVLWGIPESKHIANLIIAAPALLEACKAAIPLITTRKGTTRTDKAQRVLDQINEAIAKTEGK